MCLLSLMIDFCACYSLRYYPMIILSKLIKFLHGIRANLRRRDCGDSKSRASYFLDLSPYIFQQREARMTLLSKAHLCVEAESDSEHFQFLT